MNIFIEDPRSGCFLTQQGKWTPFQELAWNLRTTMHAWDQWEKRNEPHTRVYISFDVEKYDVRLEPGQRQHQVRSRTRLKSASTI
ncbi:MAG: hypothetical protein JWM16_259 [Verrucomicrobiales bacterium]|nr:hypothetical protein [Verrucomicrobiales bacterium]